MSEAVYVHSLSPYAIHFGGNWGIRWYGLAYVLGLFLGVLILRRLARKERFVLTEDRVTDFLTYGFIFGVFLGGRLGYFLFYDGIETLLSDPLALFKTLGGGMSSHGGILGLIVFTFYYAWRHKVSWPGLGDGLVTVAPIGLCLGRVANFVNGELYGRIAPQDSRTAMVFPSSVREEIENGGEAGYHLASGLVEMIPEAKSASDLPFIIDEATRADPAVRDFLAEHLPARYPSQLFEAALEGLLLFIVLLGVRLAFKRLPHGLLTGLFFILYAIGRITAESYREPDASLIYGFSRGQFYSFFMIAIGISFVVYAASAGRKALDARLQR